MFHQIQPTAHGALGAPMANAVQTCVHCGFCLAACPTYHVLGQEMDTPRGRIVLMKQVLEGEMPLKQALPHLDQCLGCLACEPACPSGVPYRELISPFRARAEPQRHRPWLERVRRWVMSAVLPYPQRFRVAATLGRLGQGMAGVMPAAFRAMLELLPKSV